MKNESYDESFQCARDRNVNKRLNDSMDVANERMLAYEH